MRAWSRYITATWLNRRAAVARHADLSKFVDEHRRGVLRGCGRLPELTVPQNEMSSGWNP